MNMTNKQRLTHAVIAGAAIFTLLFTGCLGVFQEVFQGEDGKTQTFVRMTMSKAMVESMDAMGGEPTDTDEIFDLEDAPFDPENIPGLDNVVVEQVNNEVDLGIRFGGIIAALPAGVQPEDAPFIPSRMDETSSSPCLPWVRMRNRWTPSPSSSPECSLPAPNTS
jgi:hypothetical protein